MALTVIIAAHSAPEQFKLVDLDVGEPGNGEVRIAHNAVCLNFIDVNQRKGTYPMQLPLAMGVEAAGVIEAVGEGGTYLKVSDPVVCLEPARRLFRSTCHACRYGLSTA